VDINTLFGLPAHPLLVHIPIVLIPLVGVGAIAMALSARARERLGWVVLGLAFVAFIGTLLAAGSGGALEHSVPRSAALREHVRLADTLQPLSAILLGLVAATVALDRYRRRGGSLPKLVSPALAVLTIVTAIGTTGWLMAVGHNGAKAAWENVHVGQPPALGLPQVSSHT
jgi:uncharacterized membrane protein